MFQVGTAELYYISQIFSLLNLGHSQTSFSHNFIFGLPSIYNRKLPANTLNSPTLYSQITGNTESRIPRSPLSNILLLLKWSDNKSTLHKTSTRRKFFFVSFFSRFIDCFALCVLFHRAMSAHQFTVTSMCTYTNVTVVIDVLVVIYNKTWENRVMLSLHGQLVLDIWPGC